MLGSRTNAAFATWVAASIVLRSMIMEWSLFSISTKAIRLTCKTSWELAIRFVVVARLFLKSSSDLSFENAWLLDLILILNGSSRFRWYSVSVKLLNSRCPLNFHSNSVWKISNNKFLILFRDKIYLYLWYIQVESVNLSFQLFVAP